MIKALIALVVVVLLVVIALVVLVIADAKPDPVKLQTAPVAGP